MLSREIKIGFMGYDFSNNHYLLPQQLKHLAGLMEQLHGSESLALTFQKVKQGPLHRLLTGAPPASLAVILSSESKQQGLLLLPAPLAYSMAHQQLAISDALSGQRASLRPIEIAFIRQELLRLLPLLTFPEGEKWISIENIENLHPQFKLDNVYKTWVWGSFTGKTKDQAGQVLFGFPTTAISLEQVEEDSLATIQNIPIPVSISVGGLSLSVENQTQLLIDNILQFEQPTHAPAEVRIANHPCFQGKIGINDDRKAVRIEKEMR